MKAIFKKHTGLLGMLVLIGALMFATYLSTLPAVTSEDVFQVFLLVVICGIGMVFAMCYQFKVEKEACDPNVPKKLVTLEIEPGKIIYTGKECDFLVEGKAPSVEMIVLAAMKDMKGDIYAAQAPMDHSTIRRWYHRTYCQPIATYGWITNTGKYVCEEEAWDIASAAKQLHQTNRSNGYLTADELWPEVYAQKAA